MRLFQSLLLLASAVIVVKSSDSCDCDHANSRGCIISEAAPPGKACRCYSTAGLRCDGEVTDCKVPDDKYCKSPDDSIWSCLQGGGDCDGYTDYKKCDCKHDRSAGCILTDLPPKGIACYCDRYTLAGIVGFACTGTDVICSQPLSSPCLDPSANIATCLQGRGNCDGYTDTCSCIPSVTILPPAVACKISVASPPNTACRCQLSLTSNSSQSPDAVQLGTCQGTIVTCKDPLSPQCLKPDTSEASCIQGGGACAYEPFSGSGLPQVYKASLTGSANNVTTKATGSVSVTLVNSSSARGYFFATSINQMTQAHLHVGPEGKNGPVIAWTFNATYGPISGSIKATFAFNPSVNNISTLLAAGQVYFNVHTTAYPAGEIRGQLHRV